jgi:hypothetical protein
LPEGLIGEPGDFGHPEHDGLAAAAGADQLADALVRVDCRHRSVVVAERRLVGDDARDGQPGRDGGEVLVLPLRRDRAGVAAVAAADRHQAWVPDLREDHGWHSIRKTWRSA